MMKSNNRLCLFLACGLSFLLLFNQEDALFGQSANAQVLMDISGQGIEQGMVQDFTDAVSNEKQYSAGVKVLTIPEINLTLTSRGRRIISTSDTDEEMIGKARAASVRWIIRGDILRISGMYFIEFRMMSTDSSGVTETFRTGEPATNAMIMTEYVDQLIEKIQNIVQIREEKRLTVITTEKKSNKKVYIILSILAAVGGGAAAVLAGGGGGDGGTTPPADLPGTPPGPP